MNGNILPNIEQLEHWETEDLMLHEDNNTDYGSKIKAIKRELYRRQLNLQRADMYEKFGLEAQRSFLRIPAIANSGGIIATLTFIGSLLRNSNTGTYDIMFLIVLLIFLFGVVMSWLGVRAESEVFTRRGDVIAIHNKVEKTLLNESYQIIKTRPDWFRRTSFGLFLIGTGFGIFQLWKLAS